MAALYDELEDKIKTISKNLHERQYRLSTQTFKNVSTMNASCDELEEKIKSFFKEFA